MSTIETLRLSSLRASIGSKPAETQSIESCNTRCPPTAALGYPDPSIAASISCPYHARILTGALICAYGEPFSMESVSLSRTYDASPATVREAIEKLGPFTEAAGFDEVRVDGDTISVANQVGFATIELTLEVVDDPDTDLTYEQREGIFEEMRTDYVVEDHDDGSEMTARTEFALDVAVVGDVLDATIIKRQRRKELAAQFDWVEEGSTRDGAAKSIDP